MKPVQYIYVLLTSAIGFMVLYLPTAFYQLTFNIAKWSVESRGLVASMGTVCGCMLAAFTFGYFMNKKPTQ